MTERINKEHKDNMEWGELQNMGEGGGEGRVTELFDGETGIM
jgi:hypothetical protein